MVPSPRRTLSRTDRIALLIAIIVALGITVGPPLVVNLGLRALFGRSDQQHVVAPTAAALAAPVPSAISARQPAAAADTAPPTVLPTAPPTALPTVPPTTPPAPTAPARAEEMHVLIDGSEIAVAELTGSPEAAYRAWTIALVTFDDATARLLYRPEGGGDPAAEVEGYIALMRSFFPGPGDRPGPMGAWRDLREAGEYADLAEPGMRYAVTQIIFEDGEVCLQGKLADEGGWYVRSWGQLSEAACAEALAQIAEGQR